MDSLGLPTKLLLTSPLITGLARFLVVFHQPVIFAVFFYCMAFVCVGIAAWEVKEDADSPAAGWIMMGAGAILNGIVQFSF